MCTQQRNWLSGKLSLAGIIKIGIAAFIGFAAISGWAQPVNDNFASALRITGNGPSSTNGSNFNATIEPGEPIVANNGGGKTIWYKWTAPINETMQFDTEGSGFDTVLGVYTGSSVDNLTLVAQNDDVAFPNDLTSVVSFAAVSNTVYYIAVDGHEGDSGNVILNWTATGTYSAGQLGFATPGAKTVSVAGRNIPLYVVTEQESSPRVRVVRNTGYAGKISFNYLVTQMTWTDIFITNFYGTNVLVSNSDGTFTNIYTTNIFSLNHISNFYNGNFRECVYPGGFIISRTNATGVGNGPTNITQLTAFLQGCAAGVSNNANFITLTNTTNSSGIVITTKTITNTFCFWTTNVVATPSAGNGTNYTSTGGTITMNDYVMAADIPYSVRQPIPPQPTPFLNPNPDPRLLRNHLLVINLSPAQLDPLESTNLAPPTFALGVTNAFVEIENLNVMGSDPCQVTNQIVNFVTSINRVGELTGGQITYGISVTLAGTNVSTGCSVDYIADYLPPANSNNRFSLQPGSDYATPPGSSPGSKEAAHFSVTPGTLTWAANDPFLTKTINVTVFYDPLVQFNEDLILQLLNPQNCVLGQQSTSTVTIVFNDQPAGAADRSHNPANSSGTVPPFNQFPGAGGSQNAVYSLAVQSDNKTVFGGDFLAYNTVPRNRVARMNVNGSLDTSFMASPNSGANDTVTAVSLQPDGHIVIGGVFTSFNATNRSHIARLNTDGSLDLSFNPGLGANGTVWATAVQADGRILIGGTFTSVNATNCNYLARLNANGSLDNTFNPGGAGLNGIVNAIAVQADGKIVIGGQFTTLNGSNVNYIARLNTNGTPDTTYNTGLGADQPVYTLTEQADGKLIAGGAFSTINITPRNHIARLNTDGTVDLSFDPGSGANDVVYTSALDATNNVLIGGLFTSFNSTRRIGVARLYSDGTLDTTFMDTAYNQLAGLVNPLYNKTAQPANPLYTIGVLGDGGVMIGGHFTQVGGGGTRDAVSTRMNIAKLVGGSTPGPGNIGFQYDSYTIDKPDAYTGGNSLYVSLVRTNGFLGPAAVTFKPNPLHQGVGSAIPNVDYLQNSTTVLWRNSDYPLFTWSFSDSLFGPDYQPQDRNGVPFGAIPVGVSVFTDINSSGNLGLNLIVAQPTGSLTLGNEPIPTGVALAKASAPMTIVDDSIPAGTLSFSTDQFYVNESATNAVVTVIRTNGSTGPVSVQYFTQPGTALPGATNDYLAVSGTLSFGSGETVKTFTVPIVDNFVVHYDNYLTVALTNVTGGATIGTASAILTIINDNFSPGILSFSNSDYTVHQKDGMATVSVVRLGGSQGIEKVSYFTMDSTAMSNVDYIATNGVLTWNNGDTAPKYIKVPLLNNGLVNSDVMLNIGLSNVIVIANGTTTTNNPFALQDPTNATLTIINDNAYGSPTLSASSYNVNENGGGVVITVNRLGGSSQTITVDYSTSDDTAVGGVDYTPVSGTLTFTNGQISQSFYVPVSDTSGSGILQNNNLVDFFVNLSNPTPSSGPTGGVSLGNPASATVTIIANQVQNQPPGSTDKTFNANAGFNANVYALALQGDGSILAGGDFTEANGIARNRIARLNANGNLDVKFSSATGGANASVRALAIQTDGQILVGGLFNTFNGVNENYFTRLNYDGTLDSSFVTGSGADNPVFAIAETFVGGTASANRKILIGGSFASVGGVPYRSIARLNENGSVDATFNAIGANGTVYAVAVYSTNDTVNGGKIIIAGDFTTVNGTNVNHVARLNANGTLDLSFNNILASSGPNDSVRSIAIQVDGEVVIGGLFTSVNGTPQNYIARLNTDGSLDTNFTVGAGANDVVSAVTLQQDLKVVLGGSFTQASSVTRNRLSRLKADGTVDAGINFGQGANDFVDALLVQPDGKLVIAGNFTQFDGQAKAHIARLFGGTVIGEGLVQFTSALYQANENGTNAVITVERIGGTGENGPGGYNGPVKVNLSTSPHTAADGLTAATDGVDYIGVTNLTLTFQPGETFQTVTIPVLNDPTNMGELYVDLTLSQPGNQTTDATLGNQPTAELGIVGANSTVSFSAANFSVNKSASSGTALITVLRNNSSLGAASVDFYTTLTGTATPGQDYTPVTNTLVFADGQASATVLIPIINNGLPEGNLTVGLALANPTNTVLDTTLPTTAVLTIVDNSLAPGNLGFSAASYSVAQTASNAVITLIRTNGSVGQVSVSFSVSGGTATAGTDYIATNGTLTFVDGQLSKTFTVPILYNTNLTGDVTVNLTLSQPTGGANITGPTTVALTILNQNLNVAFAQAGYFVDEKNGSILIGINRFGNTNSTLSVNFATANGTAVVGSNYVATSGALTFLPGQTFQTITVPILYDPQITGDLVFFANLTKTNGSPVHIVTPSTTTITVLDDDSGFALASASNSIVKAGTNALIQVVRYGSTAGSATVSYSASAGSAIPNVEFAPTNGVLTFLSGVTTNYFVVPIFNDNQIDGDRTVNLALSAPTGGASLLSPSNGVLTIVDNESGFSFSTASYSVQENGVNATITVLRTGITNDTVSVNYSTSDGTAHAPFQYTPTAGTLVFTNGQTSATFNVPIIDNNVTGGSETVLLLLTSPSASATLSSPSAATLTILNNDGSLIVPAGSAVITPANGVVSPGTSTTVLLSLRNSAGLTATNVTATILATNGVTPSGTTTQAYGNLDVNGASVFKPFTFTASGTNGGSVSVVLSLHYGTTNTGLVSFTYVLGTGTNYFYNTNVINILDVSAANPYPSSINISSLGGVISKVAVTVSNLGHSYVSDVSMLLVGPSGQKELLMEQTGGKHAITNVTLTFDSSSGNFLTTNAPVTGTYAASPLVTTNTFHTSTNGIAPPPPPYNQNLSDFVGTNPNGTWSLYVDDVKALDSGAINRGWSIAISTLNVVLPNNDLVVGLAANSSQVIVNSNLTYTITVTNAGPSPATGVTLADVLPVGATLLSVSPSQGTYVTNATGVTFNLGNLATNGTASMTITVVPTAIGSITNAVSVSGNETEDNVANNAASLTTTVVNPSADLALGATVTPNQTLLGNTLTFTINVTNLGPGTATGVYVTNAVPAGLTFLGDTAGGGYTNASNFVTSALGTLGSGASQSFTITMKAKSPGTATTTFGVGSTVFDPLKGNNSASVKTVGLSIPLNTKFSANALTFTWATSPNTYRLLSSTNLNSTNWVVVTNAITQVNGSNSVTVPVSTGMKFFRLVNP